MRGVLAPDVHAERLTDAVATHADSPTPLGAHVADFRPFLTIHYTVLLSALPTASMASITAPSPFSARVSTSSRAADEGRTVRSISTDVTAARIGADLAMTRKVGLTGGSWPLRSRQGRRERPFVASRSVDGADVF